MPATKNDLVDGKIRWDLVPWDALKEVARSYTFGVGKYGARNWEKGFHYSRYKAAAIRHLIDGWWSGETYDGESKLYHLSQACFYMLCLLAFSIRGMDGGELDDRPGTEAYRKQVEAGSNAD